MKQILILLCLASTLVFAKVQKPSNIPPASMEYIDVEPGSCNLACLKNLVSNGMNFSFLARFKENNADNLLSNLYARLGGHAGLLIAPKGKSSDISKIAVLVPENVIKGYSKVVTDAIFSYVISEKINADVRVYLSGNESPNSLKDALKEIENDKISLVVAPLTENGARYIAQNSNPDTLFFIPTLTHSSIGAGRGNIFFGGINYDDQIRELLRIGDSKIILYHDGSLLADNLTKFIELNTNSVQEKYKIDNSQKTLFNTIDDRFNDANIFLNLPISKSEFVIKELTKKHATPKAFLTTQINYAPKLLGPQNNRINLYVANSITKIPSNIVNISALFDLDISYNWVAYSTVIGVDYLYSTYLDTSHNRVFSEDVVGSKIVYETKIYRATDYKFELVNLAQ